MGFNCGIVGLPNVGKSTLFNVLTKSNINVQNYPFCTINPNIGIIPILDPRLKQLGKIVNTKNIIPTSMKFIDIAGLVQGASNGEGLGNKFIAHIRETDAIAHVVRCFDNTDIIHVNNKIDPEQDINIVETELLLADLEILDRIMQKQKKKYIEPNKESNYIEFIEKLIAHLNSGKSARTFKVDEKQFINLIKPLNLITSKPIMYIANVADNSFKNNIYLNNIKSIAAQERALIIPVNAQFETALAKMNDIEKKEFLRKYNNLGSSELYKVIATGYKLLGLATYFTAGEKEVRAWTIPMGITAPQAASKIHSDFERGFICAEVVSFDHFIKYKGEFGSKKFGKWRLEGKHYIIQDGDIVKFRFNV